MFEQTCIVELMGHNMIAGKVTEQTIGGQGFVRVDVPELEGVKGFTKFYGPGAIYAITPTDEATMLAAVKGLRIKPVEPWKLNIPQIAEKVSTTEPEDDLGWLNGDGDDGQDIYRSHRELRF